MKELLARYVDGQAAWREAKADEYPDDPRNTRSAKALHELAGHIRALPDNDPNVAELERLHGGYRLDVFRPCTEGNRLVSRYGFNVPGDDHDGVLAALVEVEQFESGVVR